MTTIDPLSGLPPSVHPDEPERVGDVSPQVAALARMVRVQDRALMRSLRQRDALAAKLERARSQLERVDSEREHLLEHIRARDEQIAGMIASRSWRLTAPLRGIVRLLSRQDRA